MGINQYGARGELLMVGAYATYGMQSLFRLICRKYLDWYLLTAVPVAFYRSGSGRGAGTDGDSLVNMAALWKPCWQRGGFHWC